MASLSERVAAAKAATSTTFDSQREDMFKQLRGKLHFKVVEELGPTLYDRQMSDAELRLRVLEMLEWALDQEDGVPLTKADRTQLLNEIASDVLGYEGIDVHRDAVVRASDKFLHVASRASERSHRQWSVDEVDLLVTAFRLRHDTGLTWPRIAEMFSGQRPLDVRLHDKIDSLRSDLENIIARVKATEDLLRDVKDGRSYAAAASETAAA